MPFCSNQHHRRSIRLKDYDYSSAGGYFVTICTYNKLNIFGEIKQNLMQLNEFGLIVQKEWLRTPEIRNNVQLDDIIS